MATLLKVLNNLADIKSAGGVALRVRTQGVMFAVALIDAALIGASAVSLATAYGRRRVSARHSLHRKVTDAKGFYAVYGGLIAVAAAVVLIPGSPLGLLTLAVQVLAGVLLPSATVFLMLLCNDKPVLGPWVNNCWVNYFTGAIIAVLIILSVILTVSVLFPEATNEQLILGIMGGGVVVAAIAALVIMALRKNGGIKCRLKRPPPRRCRATHGACRRSRTLRRPSCRWPPRPGWAPCASISSSPWRSCCSALSCSRSDTADPSAAAAESARMAGVLERRPSFH